jgi:hypothetical protein
MAKVRIKNLPKGYSISEGKVIMQEGGSKTGDQSNFGLTTFPEFANLNGGDNTSYFPSGGSVKKSLDPVPRDEANLEAEKGETALTDMNNDGDFELYNIGGKRHHSGGTPLNLPDQSFIFSDTSKMKLNKGELKEMGIDSEKKITPAKVSKNYDLNKFIEVLDDPNSDKISIDTAEYMLDKNKNKLSQLAFIQEAKKGFEEGVPLAAHPYLKSQGINPGEYAVKIKQVNMEEEQARQGLETPPTDNERMMVLQQFIQQSQPKPQPIPELGEAIVQESNEMTEIPRAQFGGQQMKDFAQKEMEKLKGSKLANQMNFVNPFEPKGKGSVFNSTDTAIGATEQFQQGGSKKKRVNLEENWGSDEWVDFKEKFYNLYAENTGTTLTTEDKEKLDQLFYRDMNQKKLMSENYDDEYMSSDDWDTSWTQDADGNDIQDHNWKYKKTMQELRDKGLDVGDSLTKDEVIQMENFYKTMNSMGNDDQYKSLLEGTQFYDTGKGDQSMGEDYKTTGYYGNDYNRFGVNTEFEEGEDTPPPTINAPEPNDPDFWLQDKLGIANAVANKFGLKKRYPVGVTYQENLIEPLYQDPGRAIAAIGEQAAIAAQSASTFAGPQRAAAVQAKAQGVAAEQIADTLAKVDNQNQKIASETNMRNAEIKWKTQEANKKELKELYNNTNLTEENYDNQLRAANEVITKRMQEAYTNRANTDNLNKLYPQFDIDPSTGGLINITDPKAFYAHLNKDQSEFDKKIEKLNFLDEKGWLPQDGIDDKTIQLILKSEGQNPQSDMEQQIMSGGYQQNSSNLPTFDQQNIQRYGSEYKPFALKRRKRRLKNAPDVF